MEATEWLDANQLAEVDELEDKKAELERKIAPVMTAIHQQSAGGGGGMGAGGGFGGAGGGDDMAGQ